MESKVYFPKQYLHHQTVLYYTSTVFVSNYKKVKFTPLTLPSFFQKLSPWDPESLELRTECYIHLGNTRKAIQDLTPTAWLRNDNRAAFLKLSTLHYSLGENKESIGYAH